MTIFGEGRAIKDKRKEEKDRLDRLEPLEIDPFPDDSGVLLSNKIRFLCEDESLKNNGNALIDPFVDKNLRAAGYDLTVGDEYFLDGKFHDKSGAPAGGKIIVPPFQVAVIKTKETVCIPRFLIARWNLRVNIAYEGLLWVGAPQVDPGYKGHLFCPLYNLSDKDVQLRINKDAIAVIDFVKTTEFYCDGVSKSKIKSTESINFKEPIRYKGDPDEKRRVIIEDYNIDDLRSALFTEASQKIEMIENRYNILVTLLFVVLALVVSAIAVLFQAGDNIKLNIPSQYWNSIPIGISIFAVLLSLLQNIRDKRRKFTMKQVVAIGFCILFLSVIGGVIVGQYMITEQ